MASKKPNLTKKVGTKIYRYAAMVKTKKMADNYIIKNKGVDILGINRQYKAYKNGEYFAIFMHSSRQLRSPKKQGYIFKT